MTAFKRFVAVCLFLTATGVAHISAQDSINITGWELQDASKVALSPQELSRHSAKISGWYKATVPGTVLTTLVNDGVYPEPLYGENMRAIPESLNKTNYWYRTEFEVPKAFNRGHLWLHFGGINYAAEVWVNGSEVGDIRGAFIRGDFDISGVVRPGAHAVLAVLVHPQPHPGVPHEHTVALGIGKNGGVSAIDGPTFLSTIGWDWLAAVRDRDTGIWQPVTLSDDGAISIEDPFVKTALSDDLTSADLNITLQLSNRSKSEVHAELIGEIDGQGAPRSFHRQLTLPPDSNTPLALDAKEEPTLHIQQPLLWWPNGYGPQNLSHLKLSVNVSGALSDTASIQFGVRKIKYSVPDSENLTLSVNGVRIMARGGNWGLDEALKRVPRERLEAQFRMHAMANLNIIRNWVGQSTSPDFYDLADRYGILLWDEFFQPNPVDGPNPTDLKTYLANVTDKVKRYRNHPSIAIWCARNEGYPPKDLDDTLRGMMRQLDPTRLYQSNSADGRGVSSHGPYYWRAPRFFYALNESFKTETGSVSIPTIESIQGMMPRKDWETINDDWAQHDLAAGAQRGDEYPITLAHRYGHIRNLADFVRKGQLANYEAFRAMFEGRNAEMFRSTTGVITWMSHPAQPSFVWQLYHYDLEPNASLFAVQKASEKLHIQLNEATGGIEVVNNTPSALEDYQAKVTIYDFNGGVSGTTNYKVAVSRSATQKVGQLQVNSRITPLYFVKADLFNSAGELVSTNFYWKHVSDDDFRMLDQLPSAKLELSARASTVAGQVKLDVTVKNTSPVVALLAHLQLRRAGTDTRVLPVFYSENYLSLAPGEERSLTIEAAAADLKGEVPAIVVDGFNVDVLPSSGNVRIGLNTNALPTAWPASELVPDAR